MKNLLRVGCCAGKSIRIWSRTFQSIIIGPFVNQTLKSRFTAFCLSNAVRPAKWQSVVEAACTLWVDATGLLEWQRGYASACRRHSVGAIPWTIFEGPVFRLLQTLGLCTRH